MAIAFNLPSEREATEENFSRLNRLLAELYEVLCRILVSRQPGQEAQETRRERPYSESDVERQRPTPQASTSCRRSASSPPLTLGLDGDLDDDVFIGPRADSGNDLFSTRNLEIFGFGSTRTPAGVLLIPQREGSFTFTVTSEKHWQDKGGTAASEAAANAENTDTDVTDAAASENPADPDDKEESPETSIFSSIIPDKFNSGTQPTADSWFKGVFKSFPKSSSHGAEMIRALLVYFSCVTVDILLACAG